jgi:hypothetical protein
MATRVNITSVEAIEAFRANLVLYISKAKPTLEEVNAEVVRTRVWVQNTQRVHWEGVVQRRLRAFEEAKNALFSAKMSNLRKPSSAELMAVTKAKRAVDEAEAKLVVLRKWDRDYENRTEPMVRQLEKMYVVLADDLVKAVTYLTQTLNTLHSYANMTAPSAITEAPAEAKSGEAAEPGEDSPSSAKGDES